MSSRPLGTLAVVCGLFVCAVPATAQTLLTGIVYDPSGFVAVDVPVIAEHEPSGRTFETRSSSIGHYRFDTLPPGLYRLRVSVHLSSVGGATFLEPLTFEYPHLDVQLGLKTSLDVRLQLAGEETVNVEVPVAPVWEPLSPPIDTIGMTFSGDRLEEPLTNGRTVQSLLNVVPGVVITESVGTLAQFTAAGQRRSSNRWRIDGVSADLGLDIVLNPFVGAVGNGTLPAFPTTGGTQTLAPATAIEEIQVRTTSASSEYARSPGAQIDIVTRAGTDRLHGLAFGDTRPHSLTASDWFSNAGFWPRRDTTFWNAGASLGGPMLRRRLFYFATGERQRLERPVTTTIGVPSMASREAAPDGARAILEAFPEPNGSTTNDGMAQFTHGFPASSQLSVFSLRLDLAPSSRHRVLGRVNVGHSDGDWLTSVGLLPTYSVERVESTSTRTATLGMTSAWSSVLHDLRLNFSHHRGALDAHPARYGNAGALPLDLLIDPDVPASDAFVDVRLSTSPGGLLSSGVIGSRQQQFAIADTWSFVRGRHEWRLGFDYRNVIAATDGARHRYTYLFDDLAELLRGNIPEVIIDYSVSASARRLEWSLFAQDTFRVHPRLSLNYGLRYSVRPAPSSRTSLVPDLIEFGPTPHLRRNDTSLWNTQWRDMAPRIAATYHANSTNGRETLLRASFGMAFDVVTSPSVGVFGGTSPYVSHAFAFDAPFPIPSNERKAAQVEALGPDDYDSRYYAFPDNLRSPVSYQWQFGLERELGDAQHLGLSYTGTATRQQIYRYQYDLGRSHNRVAQVFTNDGASDYHALLVEYARRRSRGWQATLSYTWSHAIDTDSGELANAHLPPAYGSPRTERASADYDRRHVLRLTASYQLPAPRSPRFPFRLLSNWQVDTLVMLTTGSPATVTTTKLFPEGVYVVRPDVVSGEPTWLPDPTSPTGRRANPAAFTVTQEPRQGTLGRNTLRGTPLRQVDLALSRAIRIGRADLQIRVQAFNVFNTPNFGPPFGGLGARDQFGNPLLGRPLTSYANALGTGTLAGGGVMPLHQAGGPRSLQIGARFTF